jgi:carboxylesterase type B
MSHSHITECLLTPESIRYAAQPTGNNRWKAPQSPAVTPGVLQATTFGPQCPQALPSSAPPTLIPGDEDCLFLDVYAPPASGSTKLPVLVWIHGGGYGLGNGNGDLRATINSNNKGFIGVSLQYRVSSTVLHLKNRADSKIAGCIWISFFLRG